MAPVLSRRLRAVHFLQWHKLPILTFRVFFGKKWPKTAKYYGNFINKLHNKNNLLKLSIIGTMTPASEVRPARDVRLGSCVFQRSLGTFGKGIDDSKNIERIDRP